MPEVTIGLPVRDAGPILRQALLSVRNQTHHDWELIVVDDGSADDAVESCADLTDDPRCRLVRLRRSRGLVNALNVITSMAAAPIVARLDADDVMHPHRIGIMTQFLHDHPDVDVVGSRAFVIDETGTVVGRYRESPTVGTARDALSRTPFAHPTIIGRREWFAANPYAEGYVRAEDKELWLRVMSGDSRLRKLSQPLYFYRLHMSQANADYPAKLRSDRMILRRYGPELIGKPRTARLVAQTYGKRLVQRCGERCAPLGAHLQRRRVEALDADELGAADDALRAATASPGNGRARGSDAHG